MLRLLYFISWEKANSCFFHTLSDSGDRVVGKRLFPRSIQFLFRWHGGSQRTENGIEAIVISVVCIKGRVSHGGPVPVMESYGYRTIGGIRITKGDWFETYEEWKFKRQSISLCRKEIS